MLFIPDSPYWLLERDKVEEARKSLSILRGQDYNIEVELEEMIRKRNSKDPNKSVLSIICSRLFLMPFLRIGSLMIITQWAGINVVSTYMVSIFQDSGISISPEAAPIIVSVIQLGLSMVSALIMTVSPRKPLFLSCAICILIGQLTLGTHKYLTEDFNHEDSAPHGWIPVVAVTFVQSFRAIGFMAVIQLLIAESFPTQIR